MEEAKTEITEDKPELSRIEKVKALMKDASQDELIEFMLFFKTFLQQNLKGMVRGMRR